MALDTSLSAVVSVDAEKCVNCHACIAACPVKHCNDGSRDHVSVNPNLCLGCGMCIRACSHGARQLVDDAERCFADLRAGVKMVAVVAPAVAAIWPDAWLRLNGWLRSLGVEAAFDVSFGAELTIKSYLDHLARNGPKAIIAQPCPALVTYIEIYRPELIPFLAPCDSPMLHTARMIKRFYPKWKNHRIIVCSPCAAKRREFDETGIGDYNLTFNSILAKLEKTGRRIEDFPEVNYDNPPAERAVLFSTPGGLLETARRWNPDVHAVTRKIEGPHTIYPYLDQLPEAIRRGENPVLIDCLNCELGCNGGPGTPNGHTSQDRVESAVARRARQMKTHFKAVHGVESAEAIQQQILTQIDAHWETGLYKRTYVDRRANLRHRVPSEVEREAIYRRMEKRGSQDILNCGGCGYGTCQDMAMAIHNGLNRPENCHVYRQRQVEIAAAQVEELLSETDLEKHLQKIASAIQEIDRNTRNALDMTEKAANVSGEATTSVRDLAQAGNSIATFSENITELALQTRLLALNAAIEASHAGQLGLRFAVVAKEVKDLSRSSTDTATEIVKKVALVQFGTNRLVKVVASLDELTTTLQGTQTAIAASVAKESEMTRALSLRVSGMARDIADRIRKLAELTRRDV